MSYDYIVDAKLKFARNLTAGNKADKIIIHHALAKNCTIEDIHRWHLQRGWAGIGYHFFISKDGKIYKGRDAQYTGAHTIGQNNTSIGICLEGCYQDYKNQTDKDTPIEQMDALIKLCDMLMKMYNISIDKIYKHNDFDRGKLCPGNYFAWDLFITKIIREMKKMEDVAKYEVEKKEHWAEQDYQELKEAGIEIHEKRFDDNIKRGELFALLNRMRRGL